MFFKTCYTLWLYGHSRVTIVYFVVDDRIVTTGSYPKIFLNITSNLVILSLKIFSKLQDKLNI